MNIFFILEKEKSLFEELWEYIVDKYFSVNVGTFDNFTLGTGTLISIQLIIVGLCIGIAVASVFSTYDKKHLGGFVRKLISEECLSPDTAKTLEALGYGRDPGVRGSVKKGSVLSRWIMCVEKEEFLADIEKKRDEFEKMHANDDKPPKFKAPEFKIDCNTMHFYLPEEKRIAAEIKFDSKGANWFNIVFICVMSIILCAFICYILPDLLKLVDNFLSIVKG